MINELFQSGLPTSTRPQKRKRKKNENLDGPRDKLTHNYEVLNAKIFEFMDPIIIFAVNPGVYWQLVNNCVSLALIRFPLYMLNKHDLIMIVVHCARTPFANEYNSIYLHR